MVEELFERGLDGLALSFHGPSDIAEHAQEIGSKFERLIAEFDLAERLNPLMKHVIFLLEQLELLMRMRGELQLSGDQQQQRILQLEHEKKDRRSEKLRFQTEWEQIEENYRLENHQLTQLVDKLKGENQRLMNIINQEESNRLKYESSFQKASEEVNSHYQELLANEKKKCENIQKELDFRIKKCDNLEEEVEKRSQHQMNLRELVQQLKAENMKLLHAQQGTEQQLQHQIDLINTIKQQLRCTIQQHLDEQQTVLATSRPKSPPFKPAVQTTEPAGAYLDKQQQHLQQLQLMQKQLATLSVTAESTVSRGETLDSQLFQQKLQQQLQELQQKQLEQQSLLLSAGSSPLQQSPLHRPAPSVAVSSGVGSDAGSTSTNHSGQVRTQMLDKPASKFSLNEIRSLWLERNSLQQQVARLKQQLRQQALSAQSMSPPPSGASSLLSGRQLNEGDPAHQWPAGGLDSESGDSEQISLRSFGGGENGRLLLTQVVGEPPDISTSRFLGAEQLPIGEMVEIATQLILDMLANIRCAMRVNVASIWPS